MHRIYLWALDGLRGILDQQGTQQQETQAPHQNGTQQQETQAPHQNPPAN